MIDHFPSSLSVITTVVVESSSKVRLAIYYHLLLLLLPLAQLCIFSSSVIAYFNLTRAQSFVSSAVPRPDLHYSLEVLTHPLPPGLHVVACSSIVCVHLLSAVQTTGSYDHKLQPSPLILVYFWSFTFL